VWRVAPGGGRSVAVPNVHTHELYIDGRDNLYGEHLWYEGDATKQWGWYAWMRTPQGQVSKLVPNQRGFRSDYSFARDGAGNMYSVLRERSEIRRRTPAGVVSTMARGRFTDPRWLAVTPSGVVYFIDRTDLVRVTADGKIAVVGRALSRGSLARAAYDEPHRIGGIWFDRAGSVYLADQAEGKVKRMGPDGRWSVVAESPWPWSPTGGVVTSTGSLWLLEYDPANRSRVRKVR
jgi:streptogramin lyase